MHTFHDDAGGRWTLALTVAGVKKIKAVLGIDLLTPPGEGTENPIEALTGQPLVALDAIFLVAAGPQGPSISRDDFDGRLQGPGLGDAVAAFAEEIEDFFRGFEKALTSRHPRPPNASTDGSSSTGLPESSG